MSLFGIFKLAACVWNIVARCKAIISFNTQARESKVNVTERPWLILRQLDTISPSCLGMIVILLRWFTGL